LKSLTKISRQESRISCLEKEVEELKKACIVAKYCECCTGDKRQPLEYVGATPKVKFYKCPKTRKEYYFKI
jgi:hypothetical protein